jgi:hypothetical protein
MTGAIRIASEYCLVPGPSEPHFAKLFDIHMMCWGAGRERTEDEYASTASGRGMDASWLLVSTRADDWDRRGRRGVGRRRSDAGRTRALGQTDAFGDCSLNGALGAIDAFSRRPLFAHTCHCGTSLDVRNGDPFGCGSGGPFCCGETGRKNLEKLSVRGYLQRTDFCPPPWVASRRS